MKRWVFVLGMAGGWLLLLGGIGPAYPQGNIRPAEKTAPQIPMDSSEYVIGPEDLLQIHVWKEEALSRAVPVRADGKISLPLIDEISVAGLTPLQLKEALIQKLKKYIDRPVVSVMVMEANSYKVYVSGQVRTPGIYRLRSETSLLQIIPIAGGFTEWADQKKILIVRKESGKEKRITVNYKRLLKGEGPDLDVVLKAGDTVVVP
ncbi:MAG: polysaccharide biosynthesis/export family protein [Deltaproteobacteria bacterium]|nr:polysaccharide biosynthesis/export family protein [Deltaproteobacteria bacterium]